MSNSESEVSQEQPEAPVQEGYVPGKGGESFTHLTRMNGKKLVMWVIPGLVVFAILSTIITIVGGRWWGNALNKAALENERKVQTEKMMKVEKDKAVKESAEKSEAPATP